MTLLFSDSNIYNNFFHNKKKIIIANHSTPFLDWIRIHNELNRINVNHFIYVGHCFNYENSWIKPVKTPNFVERESEYLSKKNEFCAVIFPSGGKINWRSGFYYLAKKTKSAIFLANIDYSKNNIIIEKYIRPCDIEKKDYLQIKDECVSLLKNKIKNNMINNSNKKIYYNFILYLRDWLLFLFDYGDECNLIN
jgi:hypothetical protein